MMQGVIILSILAIVLAMAGISQAGTISLSIAQSKPIVHSVDLAVNRGSFTYLYTQGQSQIDSSFIEQARLDSLKLKNPNTALFWAILPGSVVHGAGHFYARKVGTGFILLGIEMVGASLVLAGFVSGFAQLEEPTKNDNPEMLATAGVTLFVGSWLYDIIAAPLKIARENEKILEKQAALKYEAQNRK
ncbi:MAG TPA: hypothetical protein VMT04_09800 [Terriglobales bacterium]|nr:hypothetical protein [Terriglobales bacterium]